jgi:hypothetical protein
MRACFQAPEKCYVKKNRVKYHVEGDTTLNESCFKAVYGIPFGPGALLTPDGVLDLRGVG